MLIKLFQSNTTCIHKNYHLRGIQDSPSCKGCFGILYIIFQPEMIFSVFGHDSYRRYSFINWKFFKCNLRKMHIIVLMSAQQTGHATARSATLSAQFSQKYACPFGTNAKPQDTLHWGCCICCCLQQPAKLPCECE